jgi:putative membrane protein
MLGVSLAVTQLVEELFARNEVLGYLGLALAVLAALAFFVIVARETYGLLRLATIEQLHRRAEEAIASDERRLGRAVAGDLVSLLRSVPTLARGRATLESHLEDIIDGADMVRLAERQLMSPLDREAVRLVSAAAKRVSVVTAVSPRALIDMGFVLVTTLTLIRRLAYLYGGRPGALGMIRLLRLSIAHLAVTGGLAAGDSLIQQMFGHGIAAKLSAKLGEGVLNGLLTARLGLAAIEVTRPLPFVALPRPALGTVAGDLLKGVKGD